METIKLVGKGGHNILKRVFINDLEVHPTYVNITYSGGDPVEVMMEFKAVDVEIDDLTVVKYQGE